MNNAREAGLTPEEKDNAVGRGAAKGAAVGGVAGAVSALVVQRCLKDKGYDVIGWN